jgi:hypothetical protein
MEEAMIEDVINLTAYDVDILEKKGPMAELLRYPAEPRPMTVELIGEPNVAPLIDDMLSCRVLTTWNLP